jgi:hypothetical protein
MGMSSMAFAALPPMFSRNPAVDLQTARDGSLVVLGSTKSTRLTGAPEVLDKLTEIWRAADSATVVGIRTRFGLDGHLAEAAVSLLWQAGALVPGAIRDASAAERYWLSRDPAGVPVSRSCAVVSADAELADLARRCLQGSGFVVGDEASARAVLWLGGELNAGRSADQIILPVRIRETSAWIGPVHDGSPLGQCYDCFLRLARHEQEREFVSASEPLWRLAVGLSVQRLVGLACTDQPERVKYNAIEVDPARGSRSFGHGALADCPGCRRQLGLGAQESVTDPLAFEIGLARSGREHVDKPSPRFRPALGFRRLGPDPQTPHAELAAVRSIARLAAGPSVADPRRRLTPSGGDLRSNEAFYVVPAVDDADRVRLGFWSEDPAELNEKIVPRAEFEEVLANADALLLTLADLRRLASKYGSFGLKLTLLDAGCITAQAAAAAAQLGWRATVRDGVYADDVLRESLGLTHDHEYITSVVRLFRIDRPEGSEE